MNSDPAPPHHQAVHSTGSLTLSSNPSPISLEGTVLSRHRLHVVPTVSKDNDADYDPAADQHCIVQPYEEIDPTPHLPRLGSSQNLHTEFKTCCQRFKGIFAMIMSTLLLAINLNVLNHVLKYYDYSKANFLMWDLIIYTVLNVIPCGIDFYFEPDTILQPFRGNWQPSVLLILRGVCGSMILYLNMAAIESFKETAPVTIINAMAPILVYINAFLVLKEKLGYVPVINAFIAVGGVVVMNLDVLGTMKKLEDSNGLAGTGIALLSMVALSWVTIFVRLLKEVSPIVINLSFGIFGVLLMASIALGEGKLKALQEWEAFGWCFFAACNSTLSNYCYNYALKYEQAGICSLMRTSEVIFNFILQFVWFGKKPQLLTSLGATIIIFGVVCVALRKIVIESEENSKIRKYLNFLRY